MPRVKANSSRDLPGTFEELVRAYPPQAIHDEVAYRNTQEMIDALTSLPRLSKGQLKYLDTLTVLFEAYEDEHHALDAGRLGPVEALRHLMEAREMNASDLGRLLGERSLGPKILQGKRELSKSHVRRLAEHFNVSADLFL